MLFNTVLRNALVQKPYSFSRLLFSSLSPNVKERLDVMIKGKPVVVFMKGTPNAPRCGFSNAVVQILDFHGVKQYEAHDVLEDDEIRSGNPIIFS